MTAGPSTSPVSPSIEPDIDIYGKYARASALADYVEVAALKGKRITRAALADRIVDNEWVTRPRRQFLHAEDPEEDPASWAEGVFNLFSERQAQLGDLYPFEQQGSALRAKGNLSEPTTEPYVSLLALTVVHAWKLPSPVDPEPTLEAVVASALIAKGLCSVNVGATDRGTGFTAAVHQGARALGLRPMHDPKPRSRRAKDEGVDTLAGIVWRDNRPAGNWIFIGQATISKSNDWKVKLSQPEGPRWATFLQEPLHPQAFLAVPHHVEEEYLRELLVPQRGIVIDRLRLVRAKPENTMNEATIIKAMLSASVDW